MEYFSVQNMRGEAYLGAIKVEFLICTIFDKNIIFEPLNLKWVAKKIPKREKQNHM